MKQKFFTKHKKFAATIFAFIFSSSIFSSTFISAPTANAWSSAQTMVSVFGGTSSDVGRSITTDSSGNIYTVGTFRGTVDFNPGVGVANLTSAGEDVFVTKFDSNGNYIWAKNFAASAGYAVSGRSIVIDSSGFLYITGYFSSTADFDPSAGIANLTSAGNDDVFVTKLDSNGNYVWAKRFGGTDTDNGISIAVHSSGSVYVAGYFYGTADFDPGAGTANLTASGHADIYVAKLDTNGDLNWVKQIGSSAPDFAESITVDSSGSIYTTGYFYGAADFDPGAGTTNLTPNGASDAFILKLESNGSFVWAKSFGGASEESSASIKVDGSGNIHTTGRFSGTVDFDPGAGTANLTSGGTGSDDVYIAKFDSLGNYIWAKNVGGSSGDYGHSLAIDSTSNVYATGYFGGTADFDPSAGTANLTSTGNDDIFIVKLNSTGNYIWAKRVGGSAQDRGNSISVDSTGNTYVTGIFNGTVDFDPGTGNTNLSSAGNSDVYVLKLSTSGDAEVSTSAEATRIAEAAEFARIAAKKAQEQRELTELLSVIPSIAGLALNLGNLTNSLLTTKCVKGKTVKFVKKGAKCPRGFVKK